MCLYDKSILDALRAAETDWQIDEMRFRKSFARIAGLSDLFNAKTRTSVKCSRISDHASSSFEGTWISAIALRISCKSFTSATPASKTGDEVSTMNRAW